MAAVPIHRFRLNDPKLGAKKAQKNTGKSRILALAENDNAVCFGHNNSPAA